MTKKRNPGAGTQETKIQAALEAAPYNDAHPGGPGCWVSVSDIMRLGIAQYGARIYKLRRDVYWPKGLDIVNFSKWSDEDQRNHSWYRIARLQESLGLEPAEPLAETIQGPPETTSAKSS